MTLKSKLFYVISGFMSAIACFFIFVFLSDNLAKYGYIHTSVTQATVKNVSVNINCAGAENVACIRTSTIELVENGHNYSLTSENELYARVPKTGEKMTVRYVDRVPFLHDKVIEVF